MEKSNEMNALNVRALTAEMQQSAIDEINERPESVADAVHELKQWILQNPKLREACTDDQFVLAFLRGCKYNMDKSKSKIEKCHCLRQKHPQLFRSMSVDTYLDLGKLGIFNYLSRPLHDNGPRIGVFRLGTYPIDRYSLGDVLNFINTMQQILIFEDDHAVINGLIYIVDFGDATLHHFMQMTPSLCKNEIVWHEKVMPFRLKGIHFINAPALFVPIFNMMKPMFSEKQQQRLFVYGKDLEGLHEHFPQEYLPKEYGGDNGSVFDKNKWAESAALKHHYFVDDMNHIVVNQKLKKDEAQATSNIFGVEGSFKKLDID